DNGTDVSKLRVDGEGKVKAAPDMATIVLGVETRSTSAAEAAEENAILMNQTINALLDAGINESQMQTSRFSLTTVPQDEPRGADATQEPPTFLATNQVTVRLENTADVGRVLDAAVSAGSNSIQEVKFDLKDPTPQNDEAMTIAIKDAQRKAQVAASAAGLELGKILEITVGYGYVMEASRSYSYAMDATPIQPGEMEVTASVNLVYEIS
ncbi:MAG TPA: SIMPL domain-containing protein, partial [Methanothrix soehngenii]|nr:SIMPL domain-containing protein [Methanothrix soehngenii]